MPTTKSAGVIEKKLKGVSVFLAGNVQEWERYRLVRRIAAAGGKVVEEITPKLRILLTVTKGGSHSSVDLANALNANGAKIEILNQLAFDARLAPTSSDMRKILACGSRRLLARLWQYRDPSKLDLAGINLRGKYLQGLRLDEPDFTRAKLRGARLKNAMLPKAILNGAELTSADLENVTLDGAQLRSANLNSAKLRGASIQAADLRQTDLRNADFHSADLTDSDLRGAKLEGVDFTGAVTVGLKHDLPVPPELADMVGEASGPKLAALLRLLRKGKRDISIRAEFDLSDGEAGAEITASRNGSASCDYDEKIRKRFRLVPGSGNTVAECLGRAARRYSHASFRVDCFTVRGTDRKLVDPAKLKSVALAAWLEALGINEKVAKAPTQTDLKKRREHWIAQWKSGSAGIRAWNKSEGAKPRGAISFAGADLRDADLQRIEFREILFASADFGGSNLSNAIFRGCDCKRATFSNASLNRAELSWCRFNSANLTGADLSKASLIRSVFAKADLSGADLTQANLRETNLRGAQLSGAKLTGASLDDAVFDEKTQFPTGFRVPRSMLWKGKGVSPAQPATDGARSRAVPSTAPIDFSTLIQRLAKKADPAKLYKAMSMLKADRFQLYSQVTDTSVVGIVKSQTDADLVYSCRLNSNGSYACCTQNLNVCGGLRGGVCKHVLVLVIGLAKSDQIQSALVDAWVGASRYRNPEFDKNAMGETLLRYKGAEAGEVDWRPTETLPEDYYAV